MRISSDWQAARLALAAAVLAAASVAAAPGKPEAGASPATRDVIALHVGVPGEVYLGQPLAEFLAHFPGARSEPFAQQTDVVRVQVPSAGLSVLAMGDTPAKMTVESIGFNFSEPYEGIPPGTWRTVEGIGGGSNVNELLEAYGKPSDTSPEKHKGPAAGAPERIRHLYRSQDGAVTSYFVVEGSRVLRLAMSRTASIERYLIKRGQGSGSAPGSGSSTRSAGASAGTRSGSPRR
ncbi:MAG TPA: hypothetical protein VGQ67_15390 [Candidatus Polarisedimenticolia bacterium]|jgi:hypothetical protein|nr:hypothetical protein [Candidatus Polarisedimenticolia bacterium]